MGVDKFYRNVVGNKAGFKNSLVAVEADLAASLTPYSLLNPLGEDLIVTKVVVDLLTASASTPVVINVGCADATGADGDDNLIDGAEVSATTTATPYDNITDKGTNGNTIRKWASDEYLTVTLSDTPTGFTGTLYVWYRLA